MEAECLRGPAQAKAKEGDISFPIAQADRFKHWIDDFGQVLRIGGRESGEDEAGGEEVFPLAGGLTPVRCSRPQLYNL